MTGLRTYFEGRGFTRVAFGRPQIQPARCTGSRSRWRMTVRSCASDEPKLEIGDAIRLKDGMVGVVVARYTPSGQPNDGPLLGNRPYYFLSPRLLDSRWTKRQLLSDPCRRSFPSHDFCNLV